LVVIYFIKVGLSRGEVKKLFTTVKTAYPKIFSKPLGIFNTKPLPRTALLARTQTLTKPHVVRLGNISLITTAFQRELSLWLTMAPVSNFII